MIIMHRDIMQSIEKITAVTWFKGRRYEKTIRNPNSPNYHMFVDYDKNEILYEKRLWGWASFIDGKPKEPKQPKAGETIILCAKCGGFHGWVDGCQW